MSLIAKSPADWPVAPNLRDYDRERSTFSWAKARRLLEGLPGGRAFAQEKAERSRS